MAVSSSTSSSRPSPENDTLRRIAAIFDELADLPGAERQAALADLQSTDPAVAAAVARLLAAEANLPAEPVFENTIRTETPPAGDFGQYRAVRLIGQGGMGAVYLGERSDGQFSRRVAIKVIHGAVASTEEMRLRFLAERQILATLQHPGIASLLDGGISPNGEPYLVMEFIDGAPLDLFCDIHRFTVEQRLDLFLEVCAAVDFAHRHLIIHRDLKPSNILVDGEGHAKLLDFGAAKLLGPVPVDRTKQFLTPRYASPEQMRGLPAAVSMDVYALSVILYELLTGRWPFGDPSDMASNLRRASQEVQPNPPTASREAAEARSTSESGLQKALSGDLHAILAKGLEADTARRYATVAELAADVTRFRNGQPVLARPQTRGYRFRKWIARNPLQTTAAVLAVGGILTGVFLREQQRWIAEKRFDELRSLARYQMFDLQDQMLFYGSPLQVRKLMAERSLQALNTLSSEDSPSFALQADLTEGYVQLAELLGNPLRANLGENEQGRSLLSRARQMNDMLQAMQGPSRIKQAVQAQLDIQEALFDFGSQRTNDRLARARRSLEAWETAMDPASLTPAELIRMASLYHVLSVNQAQATGSVDPFATGGKDLKNARRMVDLALARAPRNHLARFADLQVKAAEAQSMTATDPSAGRQRMMDLVLELDSMETGEVSSERVRFLRARVLGALGWIEGQSQLFEQALTHLHRAVEGWGQLADQNPAQANLRYELAGALRDIAFVSGYAGDHAQAARYMEEALREHERVNAKTPNSRYQVTIAELRVRLGLELFQAGKVEEGKASIRQGQDEFVRMASAPDAGLRVWSAAARYLVDVPSPDLVRAADALVLAPKLEQAGGSSDVIAVETLIAVYASNGMRAEAEATFERYVKLVPQTNENARREAQKVQGDMQMVLTRLGK